MTQPEHINEIPGQIPLPAGIPSIHPKAQKPLNRILKSLFKPRNRPGPRIKHKKVKFY